MAVSNATASSATLIHACLDVALLAEQDGKPPVCFAVVDRSGTLSCLYRMDDAPERVVSIAIAKAYTAARMEVPTRAFWERLARESLTLADFCDSRLTSLPGGIPLRNGSGITGAVGVSGRTLDGDVELAEAFVRIIADKEEHLPAFERTCCNVLRRPP